MKNLGIPRRGNPIPADSWNPVESNVSKQQEERKKSSLSRRAQPALVQSAL